MKVRLTRQAQIDLEVIAEWIGGDDPHRAVGFIHELLDRCRSLSGHAERFPVYRQIGGRTVRKMSHRNYVILYFRSAKGIEIAHVVHGARDLEALLDRAG